jgi:hypothetical protein
MATENGFGVWGGGGRGLGGEREHAYRTYAYSVHV